MNGLKKNKDTEESRKFWEYVEKTAAEVSIWPDWKKGGSANVHEQEQSQINPGILPDESVLNTSSGLTSEYKTTHNFCALLFLSILFCVNGFL